MLDARLGDTWAHGRRFACPLILQSTYVLELQRRVSTRPAHLGAQGGELLLDARVRGADALVLAPLLLRALLHLRTHRQATQSNSKLDLTRDHYLSA